MKITTKILGLSQSNFSNKNTTFSIIKPEGITHE
jgi:hypothetical protein